MKKYYGYRSFNTKHVFVQTDNEAPKDLDPRLDLYNHSPDGFEWGYEGSGPSQLVLAILADALGESVAQSLYQRFKATFVCKFGDSWEITSEDINNWIAELHF